MKKRKTRHPGVFQVGPTTYELRVQQRIPRTDKVRSVRRVVEATGVRQAALLHAELREELQHATTTGTEVMPARPTLGDYARRWLERRVARGAKPSTLATALYTLEQGILPIFGHRYVDEIRKRDIEDWLTWASSSRSKKGKKRTASTINSWLRLLRTVLRDAVSDLELEHDPTLRVKCLTALPTRVTDDRPNSLTVEDLRSCLAAAKKEPPEVNAMLVVAFFSGMRFGELTALQWNDVQEDLGLILVRRSQYRGKVTTPKTGKTRSVPLHPLMAAALRDHRRLLVAQGRPVMGTALLFPNESGRFHYPTFVRKALKRVLGAAGISKHLSPHGMRRTFNNLMRRAQVDRAVLHATIGHSSDAMTEHYSHVDAAEKLAAVEQLVRIVVPEHVPDQL